MCEGFCADEPLPSPKSQLHELGFPVEESEKETVNGAPPDTTLPMEPCYEDTASPNAMSDTSFLPYVAFPLGSVESVSVEIVYDDGTRDTHSVTRAEVLMP